jgi:hypothetical protein
MSFPDLIIDGIRLPRMSSLKVAQSYEPLGPVSLLRLGDGTGVIQSHGWTKWSTSIQCSGWTSAGLDAIDWHDPAGVTIACITPMSIKSDDAEILLPSSRRSDEPVVAYACFGNEEIPAEVEVVDDIANIVEVVGATGYKVEWFPLMTMFCEKGVQISYDSSGNERGWSLNGVQL